VARSDFTENAFGDPNQTTDEPIAPKDTDGVERAVRGPVRLDHAEHAVKLPVDEEDNKQVVGVPEAFKVSPTPLLHRKPDHDSEREPHDPACDTGASCEVGQQEGNKPVFCRVCRRNGELCKVEHVGDSVNDRPEDDRPGGGLVEGDVLVEGNDIVQRSAAQHGDKASAHGEQDKGDVDMQNESGSTSDGEPISEQCPGVVQIVLELIVNETESEDQEVEEDPDREEQATTTLVNHPDIQLVGEFLGFVWLLEDSAGRVRPLKGLQTPPFGLVSL